MKLNLLASAALVLLALTTTPVLAYIDPGSGSAIVSAVIGFFVAIGLAVKTYWYKLKALLGGGAAEKQTSEAEAEAEQSNS